MPDRFSAAKPYLKGLILIVSLAAIGFGLKSMGLSGLLNPGWVDTEVRGKGLIGMALFVGVGTLFTAAGFPRQVVAFLGGYAFDLLPGTLLALLASTLGCALAFFYARLLGRSLVRRHFGARIRKLDDILSARPFLSALVIRFLPVGSNIATNLIAGVSRVGAVAFIAGSALGYAPQTLVFVLIGSGVHIDPTLRIGLAVALFVASAAIGVSLYRRLRGSGGDIPS